MDKFVIDVTYMYKPETTKLAISATCAARTHEDNVFTTVLIMSFLNVSNRINQEKIIANLDKLFSNHVSKVIDGCIVNFANISFEYGESISTFNTVNSTAQETRTDLADAILNMIGLYPITTMGITLYYTEAFCYPFYSASSVNCLQYKAQAERYFNFEQHYPMLVPILCDYVSDKAVDIAKICINGVQDNKNITKYDCIDYIKHFKGVAPIESGINQEFYLTIKLDMLQKEMLLNHWYIKEESITFMPLTYQIMFEYLNTRINEDTVKRVEIERTKSFKVTKDWVYLLVLKTLVKESIITELEQNSILVNNKKWKQIYERTHTLENTTLNVLEQNNELIMCSFENIRNYNNISQEVSVVIPKELSRRLKAKSGKVMLMTPNKELSDLIIEIDDKGDLTNLDLIYADNLNPFYKYLI